MDDPATVMSRHALKTTSMKFPVSLMKQRTQNHMRVHILTEECMHTDKGESEHNEGKLRFNQTLKQVNFVIL